MIPSPLIWGLLLGLGSGLHCSGMCGPIGCTLLTVIPGKERTGALLLRLGAMQVGRVSAYGGLGVAFGTVGASLYAGFDLSGVHMAVQWIAALVVIWLGLSNIGLVPSMAGIDRALAPVAGQVSRLRSAVASGGPEASLLAGMVWGLTPCAMVYGAIFNSLLTGDAISGGLMMLAFGIGTVPAVVVSSLLLYRASRSRLRIGRELSGALMIGAGVLGLLLTVPGSPFCISR